MKGTAAYMGTDGFWHIRTACGMTCTARNQVVLIWVENPGDPAGESFYVELPSGYFDPEPCSVSLSDLPRDGWVWYHESDSATTTRGNNV